MQRAILNEIKYEFPEKDEHIKFNIAFGKDQVFYINKILDKASYVVKYVSEEIEDDMILYRIEFYNNAGLYHFGHDQAHSLKI